jgi:hypothetical protein
MSGFLPADAKAFLLTQLGGQGAYVGLATALPDGQDVTLANITEVKTPGYARVAVGGWGTPTSADFNTQPVQMSNLADISFPAVTQDMAPAPYAFVTDQASASTLAAPVVTKGSAAGGGTFAAGTYYWVVTAKNAKGETIASNEISATLTANQEQAMTWAAISGATSYNVYRGTVSGGENVLVANVAGTSYTDTGIAGSAGTPPGVNLAAVGRVLWVWTLAEPVSALAGKPIKAPAGGLIIE